MKIYESMREVIGETPLVELKNIEREYKLNARLLGKLESRNPAGSAKDRIALEMIRAAEASGELRPGGLVIEPTSGNTGIGIAAVCASMGYRALIIMPNTMSAERCKLVRAYGAELMLIPGELGMAGAMETARRMHAEIENSIIAGQFVNPANWQAHYKTTGPEIWRDTDGEADVLVAGIGSGGTITGTGKYLKERKRGFQVIGVEPDESPLLTKGVADEHGIQGIGANFVPEVLDRGILDEVIPVRTIEAMQMSRKLAQSEGLLCGISSGAALCAAIEFARRAENAGKLIAVILPDTGERYLSTNIYI